jgi:hypothetical protein
VGGLGALLGGLVGAGAGLLAGANVGKLADKHVFDNAQCLNPDCGKNSLRIGDKFGRIIPWVALKNGYFRKLDPNFGKILL